MEVAPIGTKGQPAQAGLLDRLRLLHLTIQCFIHYTIRVAKNNQDVCTQLFTRFTLIPVVASSICKWHVADEYAWCVEGAHGWCVIHWISGCGLFFFLFAGKKHKQKND